MKKGFIILILALDSYLGNAQVNLNQGLVMYLPFNGNTNDASGNGNNAVNNGAVLVSDQWGNPNSAYSFNGFSNYMEVTNSASLQNTSFSISVQIKPTGFYNGVCFNNVIVAKGSSVGYGTGDYGLTYTPSLNQNPVNYCQVQDSLHESYRVYAGMNGAANSLSCITPANAIPYVVKNVWDCVTGVFDATTNTASVYVNGIFRYSYTIPSGIGVNFDNLFIGKQLTLGYEYWMNATIDELRIYDRAINVLEVQALCGACNTAPVVSNLILNNDTLLCTPNPVQLNADPSITPTTIFHWSPTNSLSDSTITNPVATPNATTTYALSTVKEGCSVVDNGDFENGNTAFTTSYYVPTTPGSYGLLSLPGTYAITTNPNLVHNNFVSFGDHTSGTGNMMVVNGASTANVSLWCQTINVQPNTNYNFSAWMTSVENTTAPGILQFTINGNPLGTPFTLGTLANAWNQFFSVWNSGASTTANICIVNQNTAGAGNDFAIDDISFVPIITQTDSVTITIATPPIVTTTPVAPICIGSTAQLSASGANNYSWTPVASLNNGAIPNPISNANTSTTYTVIGTDANGCTGTNTSSVVVNPLPIVTAFANPQALCEGSSTILSGNGATNYSWTGGITNGVSFVPTSNATYTVTGTDANGCSATSSISISITPGFELTVDKSNDIDCAHSTVTLSASGGQTYEWTPANFVNEPTSAITIANITQTTTFYVKSKSGDCIVTDSIEVIAKTGDAGKIFVPTAFSPNHDGLNDCLHVRYSSSFFEYYFTIYNRWGERVFESTQPEFCWEGNYRGNPEQVGTYYYYLRAKNSCGEFAQQGDITLLR